MKSTCSYCKQYKAIFHPRNNCKTCWTKYFVEHPNEREAMRLLTKKFGKDAIVKMQGTKYAKQYEAYDNENANAAASPRG